MFTVVKTIPHILKQPDSFSSFESPATTLHLCCLIIHSNNDLLVAYQRIDEKMKSCSSLG
jgi:hypothetical protein